MHRLKMVVTDLDGTLLKDDKTISSQDIETLEELGKKGIIRVIATGRSLKKVEQVIPKHYPFDYVIFSSGSGIAKWKSKEILFQKNIPTTNTSPLLSLLLNEGVNFKFFESIPNNDKYYFWYPKPNEESYRFSQTHNSLGIPLDPNANYNDVISQLLVILPSDMELFQRLREKVLSVVPDVSVICASSPFCTPYLWMEIFGQGVSKGHAIDWLNRYTGTTHLQTIGVGNDYNDIEMLEHTYHAFITENAPEDLKLRYNVCSSNEESGFTSAVKATLEE